MKLLIVGNRSGTNVGGCLERAAAELGIDTHVAEAKMAMDAPLWVNRFNWWLRGRRPTRLEAFGRHVVGLCEKWRPEWLLATGIAPLSARVLSAVGSLGVRTANYLTDDPWNPAHRAGYFMKALPLYDRVFSPRRANLTDLSQLGCADVSYLPFAYAPELHFAELAASNEEVDRFACDVFFAGAADADRAPIIAGLIEAGFKVGLYGAFWERFPATAKHTRGQADPRTLRQAIGGAKVALCLVRRANRDGSSMRTFELAATGACMLVEDTAEHREIFGAEGMAVVYFASIAEMIEELRWLLQHDEARSRLAHAAHRLIRSGRHTYKDRLLAMLEGADDRPFGREKKPALLDRETTEDCVCGSQPVNLAVS